MKTAQLKRSIIEACEAILSELSASDIEDMQDKLTDDGKRYSLDEVKKQLVENR